MKLTKRYLFLPIILGLLAYLFYAAYNDVKDRTLNEFNTQQFALAKQASRGIGSFFIYYQRELLFLSKLKYVSELNDQGRDLLADFYNNHSDQIEAISLVDKNGILIYTYPLVPSAIGQDISAQEHIKEVIKSGSPVVSDVFKSVQGFTTIAYHIPIISENKYQGSIAILIPLEKLAKRFIENIQTSESGYGWMISENGIELYHPDATLEGKHVKDIYRNAPSVLAVIDRTLKEKEGISICNVAPIGSKSKELIRTLTAFYRVSLGNTFWTIIIFTPENEIFAPLTSFKNRLYLLFILIVIVMVIYFYLSLKSISILKEDKKRKEIENVLRESEKRFRVMFELSPAGIILIDERGTIIEVNSAFCETLYYSRDEIIGNNIRLFSSPDREGDIDKNIAEILSGKTMKHEVTDFKKDGTKCSLALYETMILLPDGKPGILTVSNDITERKKAQQELIHAKEKAEESDRLKSAFLANISHELRTPLNAIIGFSNLIMDSTNDEDSLSNSKIINNSGHHLLSLVEDIFDIAMIESGQIKIKYEKTDLIAVMEEAKNIIYGERLWENKTDVELILKKDSAIDHKYLITDSRKLKQVLINLLKNALKFTEKGYIEFGFTEIFDSNNDYIQFYVKDTGIGIDKKNHEIVFNVFRQIDDTHTRKFGGMGLGLSIAKKIIEKLGGKIWVESEAGKGSVFYFTVPALPENGSNGTLKV